MKKRIYLYFVGILIFCIAVCSAISAYLAPLVFKNISFADAWIIALCSFVISCFIGLVILRICGKALLHPISELKKRVISYFDSVPSTPLPVIGTKEIDEVDSVIYQISRQSYLMAQGLSQEREKLRLVEDGAQDGILIINSDEKIASINKAARQFFHREYNAGYYLSNYTTSAELITAVQEVLEVSREVNFDIDDDGSVLRIKILPMSLYSVAHEKYENWAIVYIRDITSIHQGEAMRSEFFANVSHELKTPLTSMLGFGELLASGVVKEESKRTEYQLRMLTEAKTMASLIDDILNIAKLEEKSELLDTTSVDVMEIAKDIGEEVSLMAKEKKVSLFFYGDNPIIQAQPDHIVQLLKNLIVNAITYNKEGGKVETTILDKDTSVFIRVSDTGIGIPKEHQARIFERFYRVDKGRSRSLGGTGLGLSIVKHIVLNYNGTIDLKSTENIGTTIDITLTK